MASTSNTSSHSQFEEFAGCASTSGRSYDVFINHRGPDVKHTLATILYRMLTNGMGLRVFLDSEELELGDSLPTELQEAMKSASLHIAIFSKNYAQSRWCLDELSFMFRTGAKIVPIFYYINVADVRYAKGVYAEAFELHERKGRYHSEKIEEWKYTLFNVSHNIGYIVNSQEDEDMLLKSVTYCVVKEVKKLPFVVAEHPVGLEETVEDFKLATLQSCGLHQNVQIVGIWGMGGSGKTTLAKRLYNDIYPSMEKSSLILDVRDAANNNLLHKKQKKLLKDLGFKSVSIENVEEGKAVLACHLRSVRALIVLDDVDHVDQLNALLPTRESLGSESCVGLGTLIIVTTRELEVLESWSISSKYKMKSLSPIHAEELFCWHSFLQPYPKYGFEELVESFLEACAGLPLSLKVLGGQLYGNSRKDHWEAELQKISRIVPKDIKNRLKISYDALDDEEKEAFLDAACFFIGEKSNLVIEVWNGLESRSGFYSLEKLRNKCLIEIDEKNIIRVHDHLRDLGREIANEVSPYRLWSLQQTIKVYNEQNVIGSGGIIASLVRVLNNCLWFTICSEEQGTIGIRGIVASSFQTQLDFEDSLPTEEFDDFSSHTKLMVNTNRGIWTPAPSTLGLKIIVARGSNLKHLISDVSRGLVWLRWFDIGQRNLQSLSPLKNLRVLELYEDWRRKKHHLLELWVAECDAPLQLRELVIYGCREFRGFPKSIGYIKNLKKIVLDSKAFPTMNMASLPEELCQLQLLEHLELNECVELSSLPKKFGNLRNLRHLSLGGCVKLGILPDSFKHLKLLQHLDLRGCRNLTFNSDIMENMSKLEYLNISSCDQLDELPLNITNQASLQHLFLKNMKRLMEIPKEIGQLSKLREFGIGSKYLASLPASLGDLSSLIELHIDGCDMLEFLPDSVGRLNLLETLYITSSGVKFLSCNHLINLETLYLWDSPIREFDLGTGSSLGKLKYIYLQGNEIPRISISDDRCPGLLFLMVGNNDHLTEIEVLPRTVRCLWISKCPKLYALPSFAQIPCLREFELSGCDQLKTIQGLQHTRELEEFKAESWFEVSDVQSLWCMERLRKVHLRVMRKPFLQGCIQREQKMPGEIIVCAAAVGNAVSLVNSFAFPTLSVIDSCCNLQIGKGHSAELVRNQPTHSNALIVCFVINCIAPHMHCLTIDGRGETDDTLYIDWDMFSTMYSTEVEEGKWVLICVFTPRSKWHSSNRYKINSRHGVEVEKGLFMMGEDITVWEAFVCLWGLVEV